MTAIYLKNPHPTIVQDPNQTILKLYLEHRISHELFSDCSYHTLIISSTLKKFLTTFPRHTIASFYNAQECAAVQWTHDYIKDYELGLKVFGFSIEEDTLFRTIIPRVLRAVFLHHTQSFLHASFERQIAIIKKTEDILDILHDSFNLETYEDYDDFINTQLPQANLTVVAQLLCSVDLENEEQFLKITQELDAQIKNPHTIIQFEADAVEWNPVYNLSRHGSNLQRFTCSHTDRPCRIS